VTRAALRCRRVIEGRHLDRIAIIGGARLNGEIPVSGAKNSAIKLMAASILTAEPVRLTNMPRLADTKFLGQLLRQFGMTVTESDGPTASRPCSTRREITTFAPYDLVRQMRASFNVLGPLMARTGHAKVSLPGGCTIGARPVDLHIDALSKLGAVIELEEGYVSATAPKGLRGAEIEFPFVSVGATEHTLMAAVLARRHHRAEARRARAGDRRPGALPDLDGRQDRGGGHRHPDHHRRDLPERRGLGGDPGPDRDGHLRLRRRHGGGRGASDQCAARTDRQPAEKMVEAGCRGEPDRPTASSSSATGIA
jgi:hypothetical protein